MSKKIYWIILVFFLIFVITVTCFYLFFINSRQQKSNNEELTKKEFSEFLIKKEKLPQLNEMVSLIAVGDISYSRGVERVVKREDNILYPFLQIQDYFHGADLVFGNLETPIIEGREIGEYEMIFRSNPGTELALKQTNFTIVSLANNHTLNFGEQGIKNTIELLKKAGIKYIGAGENTQEANQPVFIEKKGIKFAFLAYNDSDVVPAFYEASTDRAGTAFMRTDKMITAVKEAKKNADIVIVSMHSGIEYVFKPNRPQINFAHAAIDNGADLIIGHHPHVIQTMETYKGKYIFYSLGNFIFDMYEKEPTKESLILKIYFTKNDIAKISLLPVYMEKLAQPSITSKDKSNEILKKLEFPLSDQIIYTWDSNSNLFEKETKKIIYNNTLKKNSSSVLKEEWADLNNNSVQEKYHLENGILTIVENNKLIWQSPNNWWVDNFIFADSNNDGIIDLNLSLWKSGDFEASEPSWAEKNDKTTKNYFFILNLINDSVKQIWHSSYFSEPNCEFQIADIDDDGENDLIVIEGDYAFKPQCTGKYIAVWKWNEKGFSKQWQSEWGNYTNLEIEKINNKTYIVADSF